MWAEYSVTPFSGTLKMEGGIFVLPLSNTYWAPTSGPGWLGMLRWTSKTWSLALMELAIYWRRQILTHPNNYLVLGIKEIFLMTKETLNLGLDGLVRVSQRDRATAFLVFVRPWWRIKLVMFKELQEGLLCAEQRKENSKILSDVYLKCNPQKSRKQGNE